MQHIVTTGKESRPQQGSGRPVGSIAAVMKRRDHDESCGSPAEVLGVASAEFFGGDAPKARFGHPSKWIVPECHVIHRESADSANGGSNFLNGTSGACRRKCAPTLGTDQRGVRAGGEEFCGGSNADRRSPAGSHYSVVGCQAGETTGYGLPISAMGTCKPTGRSVTSSSNTGIVRFRASWTATRWSRWRRLTGESEWVEQAAKTLTPLHQQWRKINTVIIGWGSSPSGKLHRCRSRRRR